MSTKVGLLTTLVTPSPAATPLASCVLPAPRSPVSASTVPGTEAAPSRRPISCVASGPMLTRDPGGAACAVDRSMRASIGKRSSVAGQVLGGVEVGERHDGGVAILEAHQGGASDHARCEGMQPIENADQLPALPRVRAAVGDHALAGTDRKSTRLNSS